MKRLLVALALAFGGCIGDIPAQRCIFDVEVDVWVCEPVEANMAKCPKCGTPLAEQLPMFDEPPKEVSSDSPILDPDGYLFDPFTGEVLGHVSDVQDPAEGED